MINLPTHTKALHLIETSESLCKSFLQRECKGRVSPKELEHCLLQLVVDINQVAREGLRGRVLVKPVYHGGHTG